MWFWLYEESFRCGPGRNYSQTSASLGLLQKRCGIILGLVYGHIVLSLWKYRCSILLIRRNGFNLCVVSKSISIKGSLSAVLLSLLYSVEECFIVSFIFRFSGRMLTVHCRSENFGVSAANIHNSALAFCLGCASSMESWFVESYYLLLRSLLKLTLPSTKHCFRRFYDMVLSLVIWLVSTIRYKFLSYSI